MSFSIHLTVDADGAVDVTSVTTGGAAPPAGTYSINGHVNDDTPMSAGPMIAVSSPVGTCSAAFVAPSLIRAE